LRHCALVIDIKDKGIWFIYVATTLGSPRNYILTLLTADGEIVVGWVIAKQREVEGSRASVISKEGK
jgi:hypothetical protein